MVEDKSITKWFGENLAELLGDKIQKLYKDFDKTRYVKTIKKECKELGYTKRIELHADILKELLPQPYSQAIKILIAILGEENPNEIGMFTNFYWVMPIGKFIEKYGLKDFDESMKAIEEVTKRNTGEYAIRPFLREYPQKTIKIMQSWARSSNFHLRRLAAEGSRPKLPWATKLDVYVDNPKPVFEILETLIEDDVKFVQKSVANNLTDYLKVNKPATVEFIKKFSNSNNKDTQWIIKYATRKIKI
ncbi:MAG: DNA alkylation repair protein [bacterium]|nr:DNA alkylation repair protein [bacterium]